MYSQATHLPLGGTVSLIHLGPAVVKSGLVIHPAGREPPVYVEILEPHVGKPLLPTGQESLMVD